MTQPWRKPVLSAPQTAGESRPDSAETRAGRKGPPVIRSPGPRTSLPARVSMSADSFPFQPPFGPHPPP